MIKYGDLNLAEIRDKVGLDFAHYTFKKGQCSCCYGPKDLPSRYWRNNTILEDKKPFSFAEGKDNVEEDEYTYLLFKNADNGSGCVKRSDFIERTYIMWAFPMKWMKPVCDMLQEQLGEDYVVVIPEDHYECIGIRVKEDKYEN